MINLFKMKIYKLFVSKSTYVLCIVGFVISLLYAYFSGVYYCVSSDDTLGGVENVHFNYVFREWAFSQNSDVLLYFSIVFVLAICVFSFKGYVKNIVGYVQNVFTDILTDVMVGLILWFALFVIVNIGLLLGFVMFFGSDFSFGKMGDIGNVIVSFLVEILLVIGVILLIKIVEKLTNKLAATMAIVILMVKLVPTFVAGFNMYIHIKHEIDPTKISRFELITAQTAVVGNTEISLADLGITACIGVAYCAVFSLILFLMKRKDRA